MEEEIVALAASKVAFGELSRRKLGDFYRNIRGARPDAYIIQNANAPPPPPCELLLAPVVVRGLSLVSAVDVMVVVRGGKWVLDWCKFSGFGKCRRLRFQCRLSFGTVCFLMVFIWLGFFGGSV